ncbi:monocarboxylate transporter 5-like [Octopus sinensis]|uniref:Monocarboxylate transporter 5-like n=1 Tax=Octopus sinensis TaxID=2607531 RepID=A0A6P7T7A5_9MOLL|nr:monocarboxylate transporter 5-like [Octopus sinensis]XP_036365522.1 monocarboxylate transporter 5-like [Octopus sinensis]XP_036365523.1 monocarboxylate transporter 5-like [Octopus sinensis]
MNSNDKDTMEKETTQTMRIDRRPIDRGWAWVVLTATTLLMLIVIGNARSFGIFLLEIQHLFSASSSAISIILSTEYVANCITGFAAMNLLAKFISFRTFVICGCTLCSLTFIFDSISKDVFVIPFIHLLNGAGLAFIYGSCIVMQSTYFNRYLGTANAISACGVSVGQFTLPYLLNYLIVTYGVRGALLLNAGIFLQCLVFGALLRPISYYDTTTRSKVTSSTDVELNERNTTAKEEKQTESIKLESDDDGKISPFLTDSKERDSLKSVGSKESTMDSPLSSLVTKERTDLKDGGKNAYSTENSSGTMKNRSVETDTKPLLVRTLVGLRRNFRKLLEAPDFTLFREKKFISVYIGTILGTAASSMPQAFFPAHAVDLDMSSEDGVIFLTVGGVADFVGRLLMVLLADRKFLNRAQLLGVTLITHGVAACFVSFYTKFFLFAMYCACYGISSGIYFSISNTVMVDFIGSQRMSDAIGLMILGSGIIGTISFPFTGYLRDVTGSYKFGFILNGVCLLISGALFLASTFIIV